MAEHLSAEERARKCLYEEWLTSDAHTRLVCKIKQHVEEAEKQRGAKVLAACIADVDAALAIFMENEGRSKDEKLLVGGTCLAIKNRLAQLQPAASDLEALLREEWNKAIDVAVQEAYAAAKKYREAEKTSHKSHLEQAAHQDS